MKDHIMTLQELTNIELNLDVIETLHGGPVYPGLLDMEELAEKPMSMSEINRTLLNIDLAESMRGVPTNNSINEMRAIRSRGAVIICSIFFAILGIMYIISVL